MRVFLFTFFYCVLGGSLFSQDALREARQLSDQHAYQQSSQLLMTFIQDHPQRKYDLGRAWILHSHNLLQGGNLEQAKVANDHSLNLRMQLRSPEIAENYLQATQIHLANERPDDALVTAQQGMQMLIENPLLYAELNLSAARALNLMGRYDDANRYFQTAIDVLVIEVGTSDIAYGQLLRSGGRLLAQQKQYESALQRLAVSYATLSDSIEKVKTLLVAYGVYWRALSAE
jgi:tetratricopeptide (TPR) repeat protein